MGLFLLVNLSKVSSVRVKMTIAYDGRPYEGWATQPGGNTIQDHLERAIGEVAKQKIRIHGAGRTDTGVHALGQIAHFDVPEDRATALAHIGAVAATCLARAIARGVYSARAEAGDLLPSWSEASMT